MVKLSVITMVWLSILQHACKPRRNSTDLKAEKRYQELIKGPLTHEETLTLYHKSQGSEVFPFAVLRSLTVDFNGKKRKLLEPEVMKSFGFLESVKDPKHNPFNLPVGISLAIGSSTGLVAAGVQCAACHVGELEYSKEKTGTIGKLRIDGGINMVDFGKFTGLLLSTIQESLQNNITQFTKNVIAENEELNRYFRNAPRPNWLAPSLEIDKVFSKEQLTREIKILKVAIGLLKENVLDSELDFNLRRKVNLEIEELSVSQKQKAFLFERILYLLGQFKNRDYLSTYGHGRTDPWTIVRNVVFAGTLPWVPPNAPIKTPRLWHSEQFNWLHYSSNTNSIVGRNIVNCLGLGGLITHRPWLTPNETILNPSFDLSFELNSLNTLEHLFWKIPPPNWPADAEPIKQSLAEKGKNLFSANCQHCHSTKQVSGLLEPIQFHSVKEIGTDSTYFENFNRSYQGHDFLEGSVTNLLTSGVENFLSSSPQAQANAVIWGDVYDKNLNPSGRRSAPVWRNPNRVAEGKVLQARPLDGIWASAPYLHNGSVPTIYDLLQPVDKRPKTFVLGGRMYDLKKLGYSNNSSLPSGFNFQVNTPGNSNSGHVFGTTLQDEEKWAIIEYLKGLGGGNSVPTSALKSESGIE